MITFGPKGFRKHLEALPEGATAGYSNQRGRCPLARYGLDQGAYEVSIDTATIDIWTRPFSLGTSRSTQYWQTRFINIVDQSQHNVIGAPITREQALAALDYAEGVN